MEFVADHRAMYVRDRHTAQTQVVEHLLEIRFGDVGRHLDAGRAEVHRHVGSQLGRVMVGHEVEAEVLVDAEAEMQVEVDVDPRAQMRAQAEGRQAEVDVDLIGLEGKFLADVKIELQGVCLGNVIRRVAVLLQECRTDVIEIEHMVAVLVLENVQAGRTERVEEGLPDQQYQAVQIDVRLPQRIGERLQHVDPEILDEV